MKKMFIFAALAVLSTQASAIELVCKGSQARDKNQRPVAVDCSDRKAVINALGSAWRTLRSEQIGGSTEDMCWKPYNRAKEMHPSVNMQGVAPSFFMQCNMALRYVK